MKSPIPPSLTLLDAVTAPAQQTPATFTTSKCADRNTEIRELQQASRVVESQAMHLARRTHA
jgi:hypothetical protein